jgi:hypothetical protein
MRGYRTQLGFLKKGIRNKLLHTIKNFRGAVRMYLSRDVLTTERVCRFYARARTYILACLALALHQEGDTMISEIVAEKMVKQSKTYLCTLDF